MTGGIETQATEKSIMNLDLGNPGQADCWATCIFFMALKQLNPQAGMYSDLCTSCQQVNRNQAAIDEQIQELFKS